LQDHYKLNIEPNHTTLAGHDYEHDIRLASAFGMLGSVDCNAGDLHLGWDTDLFPTDLRKCTLSMMIILEQGGLGKGGNNFDCKLRRESTDPEDLFVAHVVGMDTLARGLRSAAKALEAGALGHKYLEKRYISWNSELGKKVEGGKSSLEELEEYAKAHQAEANKLISGKHEFLEGILNSFI